MPGDFDDSPTDVDAPALPDPVTAPHHTLAAEVDTVKYSSLEHATGREAGYTDGVERAIASLRAELTGWTPNEVAALVYRLRTACRDAG